MQTAAETAAETATRLHENLMAEIAELPNGERIAELFNKAVAADTWEKAAPLLDESLALYHAAMAQAWETLVLAIRDEVAA